MHMARSRHGPRRLVGFALALAFLGNLAAGKPALAEGGTALAGGKAALAEGKAAPAGVAPALAEIKPPPEPGRKLEPQQPVAFSADSRHPQTFSLVLGAGDFVEVRIEQLRDLAQVEIERPGQPPEMRFRDTGREGIIRVSLAAELSGSYRLRILPYEPAGAAAGRVIASPVRAATPEDRARAAAEVLQARAEWARRKGAASSWAQALRDYEAAAAAARRLGDVSLLRAALTGEARLDTFRLGDYRAAVALAEKAAALPEDGDEPGQALAWKTLASCEYYVADYSRSIRAVRRALALYRDTGDAYWQGILLGNLAYTYRETGQGALALRMASESLAIARSIHDGFGIDFDLEALAEFHLARGELDQSFELYQQALEALREHPYPQEEAAVWNGLGELFEIAGDHGAEEDALQRALQLALRAHDSAGALKVLGNLGDSSLLAGDARAAMRYYEQGLERARALRLPREESFLLAGLGSALAVVGDGRDAPATFHRAIDLAARISQSDSEAAAWQGLGDYEARSGGGADAAAAYERSFELWSREANRVHAATALASLARLDFARGALDSAHARIERALELIETSRATLTSRDLRTSYFASQHAYYDLGISILMALDRRSPGRGYDLRALQLAERGRARTLLDALHGADQLPAGLVPAEVARALRQNREELDAAYARWRDLLEDASAGPAQFDALRARIDSLLRSGDELEARARAQSERYATLAAVRPASLAEVRRTLLAPGAALLCYWLGEDRGYAWWIRRDGLSTRILPGSRVLAREVGELRGAVTARLESVAGESVGARVARVRDADQRAEALAAALGAEVLPEGEPLERLHTLYVVPDGPLSGVPFAALRAPGAAASLVETTTVLEEPSASVLLSLASAGTERSRRGAGYRTISRRNASPGGVSIAVFADPVYTRDDPRLARPVAEPAQIARVARITHPEARTASVVRWAPEETAAHLPRLVGSGEEAQEIESLSGPGHIDVRMGFAATARAVREVPWARYDIAHFAVHALVEPQRPEFSGLVLTMFRPDGTPEDGVLRLRDIYALDMPVDLVVLSGCRTLEGREVAGEGLVGLYRAFLMAGAHAVLGSLWSVEDEATSRFMKALYEGMLARGLSAADALRGAQRVFLHSRDFAAPYYWAGFSVEGAAEGAR